MSRRFGRLLLLVGIGLLFGAAAWTARGFPFRARVFPMTVGGVGVLVTLAAFVREWMRDPGPETVAGPGDRADLLRYLGWVLGYYVLIWLAGFVIASGVFVAAFLLREARARPWAATLGGVVTGAALWALGAILRLQWIPGRFGG